MSENWQPKIPTQDEIFAKWERDFIIETNAGLVTCTWHALKSLYDQARAAGLREGEAKGFAAGVEKAARLCEIPYDPKVGADIGDIAGVVGKKLAKAIRSLSNDGGDRDDE